MLQIHVISKAPVVLPFTMADATRSTEDVRYPPKGVHPKC